MWRRRAQPSEESRPDELRDQFKRILVPMLDERNGVFALEIVDELVDAVILATVLLLQAGSAVTITPDTLEDLRPLGDYRLRRTDLPEGGFRLELSVVDSEAEV